MAGGLSSSEICDFTKSKDPAGEKTSNIESTSERSRPDLKTAGDIEERLVKSPLSGEGTSDRENRFFFTGNSTETISATFTAPKRSQMHVGYEWTKRQKCQRFDRWARDGEQNAPQSMLSRSAEAIQWVS